MIECQDVSFSYPASDLPGNKRSAGGALKHISCTIEDGSFVLLCGASGCGKTTMTRLFNGLIPHYHEGAYTGSVYLDGKDTRDLSLFDISLKVGSVFQNPRSQFFNVDTTSELAFGPENHGMVEDYTLRDLRENITAKLARVPMGTILDTPSGQYKTTIVDRVEGMEPTFAHLIPEMTANVLVPLVIAVYLFLLDWRMALLSLVTLVVGLAVMSAGMKNYPVKWEGAVKAGKQMANAIVEYIGGIEVVKAFSQSAGSYKKYSDAVNYNANYYVDWMRENQKTMSAYNAILPSVLICVLPCGFAFWISGSLELSTFLSIVIFSLGLIGPIVAAFTFTDDLAVLGTNVEEISQLLNAEELNHKDTPVKLEDTGISLRSVSSSYDGTTEVLHGVSLTIRPGTWECQNRVFVWRSTP